MKYADLLAKYRTGHVSESDLDGVTAEDWMKVRLEAGDGILSCALTDDALVGLLADHPTSHEDDDEDEDDKKKSKDKPKGKPRSFAYVMVSDAHIPPFADRVEAKAWDLKEFRYRGGVILYDHNFDESRPPIGKGTNLQKGVEMKRGGREFKALTGDVTFADREIHPFAGMIGDLVEAKLLTNGSVGFDIVKMRAPTDDEVENEGFKPFSAIIQKANLFEFSITPLGRDPNAQRLANDGIDPLEAKLAEFAKAGVYDDSVIGEFREGLLSKAGDATRCSVTMPQVNYLEVIGKDITVNPKWTIGSLDSLIMEDAATGEGSAVEGAAEFATGGIVDGVPDIFERDAAWVKANGAAGMLVPTEVAQTLGLVETTTGTATNVTDFTIYEGVQTPILPNGVVVQQAQFADVSARAEIVDLKSQVVELNSAVASLIKMVETLSRSRDEDLYELLLGADADRATEAEGSAGSDEPADHINDVAIQLGL